MVTTGKQKAKLNCRSRAIASWEKTGLHSDFPLSYDVAVMTSHDQSLLSVYCQAQAITTAGCGHTCPSLHFDLILQNLHVHFMCF